MSKNIVIFSDGTGQEGGEGPDTNVYKLFKAVENRTPKQIAFYDKGLGTGKLGIGKATGVGIKRNILDCYRFIFENYEAGDDIYMFGFSRGAATVRSLSGFIATFGILPKSRPELIAKAYKIYKIKCKKERTKEAEEFCKKYHTMWAKVKFLGVWDTVAALGVPIKSLNWVLNEIPWFEHKYHDYSLSSSVTHAYHALSIDEERKAFLPTLWNDDIENGQIMEQVWFCGVHTDIGGGYAKSDLSHIALNWMVEKAVKCELKIYDKSILKLKGDSNGYMHDSRRDGVMKYSRKKERFWSEKDGNGKQRGKPVVHPSVLLRTLNKDNETTPKYDPWILKL